MKHDVCAQVVWYLPADRHEIRTSLRQTRQHFLSEVTARAGHCDTHG
jgi:hypothetical protein